MRSIDRMRHHDSLQDHQGSFIGCAMQAAPLTNCALAACNQVSLILLALYNNHS